MDLKEFNKIYTNGKDNTDNQKIHKITKATKFKLIITLDISKSLHIKVRLDKKEKNVK